MQRLVLLRLLQRRFGLLQLLLDRRRLSLKHRLVVGRHHPPDAHVRRSVRPSHLPREHRVRQQRHHLHGLVEHGHGRGPRRRGRRQRHGQRERRVLVARLDGDADALRPVQPHREGHHVAEYQTGDARHRDSHEELPRLTEQPVPAPGGEHQPERDEREAGDIRGCVKDVFVVGKRVRRREAARHGDHDHRHGYTQWSVLDVYAVRVGRVDVDCEVHREHEHRADGRDRGHGDTQRQVGVEDEAPPVAVAAARRGRGQHQHYRLNAHHPVARHRRRVPCRRVDHHRLRVFLPELGQAEYHDRDETEERKQDELTAEANHDGKLVLELLLELVKLDRAGQARDQDEQQDVAHDAHSHVGHDSKLIFSTGRRRQIPRPAGLQTRKLMPEPRVSGLWTYSCGRPNATGSLMLDTGSPPLGALACEDPN